MAALILCAPVSSVAQADCTYSWTRTYDGGAAGDDRALGVSISRILGIISVAGYTDASSIGEGSNWFVRSYFSSNVFWSRTLNWSANPAQSDDEARAVATASNGNVFVAGFVDRSDEGTNKDWMLQKYDQVGDLVWSRTYSCEWNTIVPPNDNDRALGVAVDPSGSVIAVGFEDRSEILEDLNLVVRKYDGDGNLLWSASSNGGGGPDAANAVVTDSSGNIIVAGYEYPDIAVIKYDSAGAPMWKKTWNSGGGGVEQALAVGVDGSGSIYIGGFRSRFSRDALVLKYDPAGNLLYSITYDSPALGDDEVSALAVQSNGNFVAGGTSARPDLGQGDNWFLRKYDSGGRLVWFDQYDSPAHGNDGLAALAVDSTTQLVAAGYETRPDLVQGEDWRIRNYATTFCCSSAVLAVSSATVSPGSTVTVTLTVINGGEGAMSNVTPALSIVAGAAALENVSGPSPASASTVAGLTSQKFTWVWQGVTPGTVTFSATATGTDAGVGTAFKVQDSCALVVAEPPWTTPVKAGTTGNDFWLAFPVNDPDTVTPSEFGVLITSATAATGKVEVGAWSAQFTLPAGGMVSVTVTEGAGIDAVDAVLSRGVHVTASANVAVWGMVCRSCFEPLGYASDGWLALPTPALGCEHLVLGYGEAGSPRTEFLVVATRDGTDVAITPTAAVGARTKGVEFHVTMNRGQAYRFGTDIGADDLTGTAIRANAPIAVIAGSNLTNIPVGVAGDGGNVLEQMLPTKYWGTRFVAWPAAGRPGGDTWRVLASANGTAVSVNGGAPSLINRGGVAEFGLTGPVEIVADHPVLAAQCLNSGAYDGTPADPAMILLPSVDQLVTDQRIVTPSSTLFAADYLNVTVPSGAAGSVRLDGAAISATVFSAIGISGYSGASLWASKGAHHLTASSPFWAAAYGYGQSGLSGGAMDAYGFPGVMSLFALGRLSLAGPAEVERYKDATYTISWWNREALAADFLVWDSLPAGMALVSASGGGTLYGNAVAWSVHAVPAGGTGAVAFTVRAKGAPGTVLNSASANYFTSTCFACPVPLQAGPVVTVIVHPPLEPVRVYPNPFNPAHAVGGMVKFQGVKPGGKLRIWTVSGLLVWEATAGVDPVEWDGKNKDGEKVVAGVYYWTAEGETGKQKGRVLVQR